MRLKERVEIGATISFLDFPLTPRTAVRTLRNILNRILVLIKFTTSEYLSPRFSEIRVAIRLWNFLASTPIPPKVDMTIGVNDPFST